MSSSNRRRDRNLQRPVVGNPVAANLVANRPRDTSPRALPHWLPGCSLDENGKAVAENARQHQAFEDGAYIAVCNVVARRLQEFNTCNRPKSEANIMRIYDAMMSNEWRYNGKSSTLVCSNTALLDSQHFLEATVRYFESPATNGVCHHVKKPFLMRVEMGLPPETFATYDNGAKRTVADTLAVGALTGALDIGNVSNRLLAQSQRVLLQYLNNVHKNLKPTELEYLPTDRSGLVNSRAVEILKNYPGLISSAAFVTSLKSLKPLVKNQVAVVGHMLLSEVQSTTAANAFLRSLATGADLDVGSPILALRSVYTQAQSRKRRMEGFEALAFFFRAWNFYAAGKSVSTGRLRGFDPDGSIPVPQRLSRNRSAERADV